MVFTCQDTGRCVRCLAELRLVSKRTSEMLFSLGLRSIEVYVHRRQTTWLGHVGRMSFERVTRRMATCWVHHKPGWNKKPKTWGRSLQYPQNRAGLNPENGEWLERSKDREGWRKLVAGIPVRLPPRSCAQGAKQRSLSGAALERHPAARAPPSPIPSANFHEIYNII